MATFGDQAQDRIKQNAQIRKDNENLYYIIGGILLILVGVLIGAVLFTGENPPLDNESGYWTNLFTEVISITVTVAVLGAWYEQRRINQLRKYLVHKARSRSNDTAVDAIDDLQYYGWITGENELLKGLDFKEVRWANANLRNANLEGTELAQADLQAADLEGANLQKAELSTANLQASKCSRANFKAAGMFKANLENADLREAILQEAYLRSARLQSASLSGANLNKAVLVYAQLESAFLIESNLEQAAMYGAHLERARLHRANLEATLLTNANLQAADLRGANLQHARTYNTVKFNEKTILPDGTHWTPDTDMARFTDPNHPEFWRSDNPDSPAYGGN